MRPLLICLFYGLTATMMNLSNKVMITNFDFRCTFILLFVQYSFTVLVIEATRFLGIYKHLPEFSVETAFETLNVTLASMGNVTFGLFGMAYINLPMYVALRKLITAIIYAIDIFYLHKPYDL